MPCPARWPFTGRLAAWYVALAEALGATLVTTDTRLRRVGGPRCPVLSPEDALAAG